MVSLRRSDVLTATVGLASVAALSGTLGMHPGRAPASFDTAAASAQTAACTATVLPNVGGRGGNVVAASSNGIYVGFADDSSGRSQPVIWRAGRVSQLK